MPRALGGSAEALPPTQASQNLQESARAHAAVSRDEKSLFKKQDPGFENEMLCEVVVRDVVGGAVRNGL